MPVSATVELTENQVRFVRPLASGRAPMRATREAGYAVERARNILAKEQIRAALRVVSGNAEAVLREIELQR